MKLKLMTNQLSHHVRIVPVSRTSIGDDDVLVISVVVDGPLHAVPRVLDVVKVPPETAGVDDRGVIGRHAGVGLVHGPRAGVDHRSASLVEPVAKLRVALVHVVGVGVAAVQLRKVTQCFVMLAHLHIVNAPRLKSVGILLEMAKNARVASAGVISVVLVDAKLEPL